MEFFKKWLKKEKKHITNYEVGKKVPKSNKWDHVIEQAKLDQKKKLGK